MKFFGSCHWAVVSTKPGDLYDDGKPRTSCTAIFCYHYLAEEFIEKVIPAETRDRFQIVRMEELNNNVIF